VSYGCVCVGRSWCSRFFTNPPCPGRAVGKTDLVMVAVQGAPPSPPLYAFFTCLICYTVTGHALVLGSEAPRLLSSKVNMTAQRSNDMLQRWLAHRLKVSVQMSMSVRPNFNWTRGSRHFIRKGGRARFVQGPKGPINFTGYDRSLSNIHRGREGQSLLV
jgi:hypothetical protein